MSRKNESRRAASVLHKLAVRLGDRLAAEEREALDLAISILQARAHDAEAEEL